MEPRDGAPTPRIVETPSGLLNAIGLQGVGIRAFVRDVLPRLREARHRAPGERLRRHRRRVRGGVPRLRRRPRHRRPRDQHLLPQREEGRHGLRRRPTDDPRGGGGGAEGDPPARHPEAVAQRGRHHGLRPCRRGGRGRRALVHQHAPRPRDRRRDAAPEARLRHRRALRPGHPPGGRADGLAGRTRGEDPGDRDRRHRRGAGRPRVPDRGLPRGADRHRELRRPRDLRAHPGRPAGLPRAARSDDVNAVVGTLEYPGLPRPCDTGGRE